MLFLSKTPILLCEDLVLSFLPVDFFLVKKLVIDILIIDTES